MTKKIYKYTLIAYALLLFSSCKKPYAPPAITSGPSHLVVEGSINTGADSTIIRLTHTIPLSTPSDTPPPAELSATVSVESDANATYPLSEIGDGYYATAGLNLNAANKYRLKIITAGNKVYESDFVPVRNSQDIDSVSYKALNTGVQINVSTHDPSNSSRYYKYAYDETWIIHSDYHSYSMVSKTTDVYGNIIDTIIYRDELHQIFTCWAGQKSSTIVLGSTDKLAKDVLSNLPILFIDSHSEKLGARYSILVKQQALTKEAFEYYQQLSKNTEKLGGMFDPQPSLLAGNIHNTADPAEQVIGFVTAGTTAQKRIFIDANKLPAESQYIPQHPFDQCKLDTFLFFNPATKQNDVESNIYHGNAIPVLPVGPPGHPPAGYSASGGICVDCTLRGTNVRPSFWTDQQ
jgi:hypothetical protein